jgi:hypothetical protein
VSEKHAIVATALDYFEGWYDADLDRVDRALHPQLVKRRPVEASGENPRATTKQMMLDYVRKGGGAEDKTDDPIEVDVIDIHHDIATAVVRSTQYREYLHLLRTRDGWRIVDAFWQFTEPDEAAQS